MLISLPEVGRHSSDLSYFQYFNSHEYCLLHCYFQQKFNSLSLEIEPEVLLSGHRSTKQHYHSIQTPVIVIIQSTMVEEPQICFCLEAVPVKCLKTKKNRCGFSKSIVAVEVYHASMISTFKQSLDCSAFYFYVIMVWSYISHNLSQQSLGIYRVYLQVYQCSNMST